MMDALLNSQFWYLGWMFPIVAVITAIAAVIIGKRQSREFFRQTVKWTDPEAYRASAKVKRRTAKRLDRWVTLFIGQINEARSHRDTALLARKTAEEASTARSASIAASAARAAAEKAADAARGAATTRKVLPPRYLPESERGFPLRAPLKPPGGKRAKPTAGAETQAAGARTKPARRDLDPANITTSATQYAAEAAEAAEAIAARWKQSQAAE